MQWRKAWERSWDGVRYCSQACKRRKVTGVDRALEEAILTTLDTRKGSMCPSEAARMVDPDNWRELMEPARRAARRLVITGKVVITQGGRRVDPSSAKGPIRIERSS